MKLFVKRACTKLPPEQFEYSHEPTRAAVKQFLSETWNDSSVMNSYLVWGGSTISSDSDNFSTFIFSEEDPLWIVPQSTDCFSSIENINILVQDMFDFQVSERAKSDQGLEKIKTHLKLLTCTEMIDNAVSPWISFPEEGPALRFALASLKNETPCIEAPHISWFGQYGCALVSTMSQFRSVHLMLISLDAWSFKMQSGETSYTFTGKPSRLKYSSIFIGMVPNAQFKNFLSKVHKILEKCLHRKGDKRSAAGIHQGHQKTAAMIHAIMVQALNDSSKDIGPRGGFTDVGLHTGGEVRNTSWPLILAVVQELFYSNNCNSFHRLFLSRMYLCLVESSVRNLLHNSGKYNRKVFSNIINNNMQLLVNIGEEAASIGDHLWIKYGMDELEARSVCVRFELETVVQRRAQYFSKLFLIQPLSEHILKGRNPRVYVPDVEKLDIYVSNSIEDVEKRVYENSGWLPQPVSFGGNWSSLESWMSRKKWEHEDCLRTMGIFCVTVERFFFEQVCDGINPVGTVSLDRIDRIVEKYRTVVNRLFSSTDSVGLLSTEMKSREVILVWITYCLAHSQTKKEYPLLANYSVCLHANDLRFLILSDKLAIDAAHSVGIYLSQNSETGRVVFSGRENDQTFELAAEFSKSSGDIQKMWKLEEGEAKNRQERQWKIICSQKDKLLELDQQLKEMRESETDLEVKLEDEKQKLSSLLTRDMPSTKSREEQNALKYRIEQCRERLNSKRREIQEQRDRIEVVERPPKRVMQPLPGRKSHSEIVLFFLMMPKCFQVLSKLSFTSQQMLLPRSSKVSFVKTPAERSKTMNLDKMIGVQTPGTLWHSYVTRYSVGLLFNPENTKVILGSSSKENSNEGYAGNVRNIHSVFQGVWHPDILSPKLFWKGGDFHIDVRDGIPSSYFNPFVKISQRALVENFIEPVKSLEFNMKWAFEQRGELACSSRGNWGEASQYERPSWLPGKPEHLSYASLRAYPYQQFRKLCTILHERSVPFGEQYVRLLILQALYQIGDVSNGSITKTQWRTDLTSFGGWHALSVEIDNLIEDIKNKPRDYKVALIVGEIGVYAAQWNVDCQKVVYKLAKIVEEWADELLLEDATADPERMANIRARKSLFFMYSTLFYGAISSKTEEITKLCKVLVLADYYLLLGDSNPHAEELHAMKGVIYMMMARKLPEILTVIDGNSEILTNAVQQVLHDTPSNLEWHRLIQKVGTKTTCYVAKSCTGDAYCLNMQSGALLLNGRPPQRLPESITSMPLYKSVFSDRNFEVALKTSGAFQTVRPIQGCFYEFKLSKSNENCGVYVRELYEKTSHNLELLDGTPNGINTWGEELPIRLKRMYSHWFCRKQNIILFRPKCYRYRDPYYVFCLPELSNTISPTKQIIESAESGCYLVPSHLRERHWTQNVAEKKGFEKLVVIEGSQSSQYLEILGNFESVELIQSYIQPSGTFVLKFPRYGLDFMVSEDGTLVSKSFSTFQLSSRQQLCDALHGFKQYLLLESGKRKKMLVPAGVVCRDDFKIFINIPQGCADELKFHSYNVHPRFNTLEASSGSHAVLARLQLAALYAATSSLLPDSRSLRTGGEIAMELVRQSWKNKPCLEAENQQVESICNFSQGIPGLRILCFELRKSAHQLLFLHQPEKSNEYDKEYSESPDPGKKSEELVQKYDVYTDYMERKNDCCLNKRAILTNFEEREAFGSTVAPFLSVVIPQELNTSSMIKQDSSSTSIEMIERCLSDLLQKSVKTGEGKKFLLENERLKKTELGRTMLKKLRESWEAHQSISDSNLKSTPIHLLVLFKHLLVECGLSRKKIEDFLINSLSYISSKGKCFSQKFKLRRTANLEPYVNIRDLAKAAFDSSILSDFNPLLSTESLMYIHKKIFDWLQLCVLEDKMERLCTLSSSQNVSALVREMKEVGRPWSVSDHPEWLVFEVEQTIQIRSMQYTVAKYCMENPGMITQLNMGEGKTRVILPLIVLHMANKEYLVRLHFLSPLLGEAYDYLHGALTASLLCRRMCFLPFNRDITIDVERARYIRVCLMKCLEYRGALCVAREHRLSLYLKWDELELSGSSMKNEIQSELEKIYNLPYFDVLDESDELLQHQYQLIYAVGGCTPLPDGKLRWIAAQAVLKQIQNCAKVIDCSRQVMKRQSRSYHGSGVFDDIRLIPGSNMGHIRIRFLSEIVKGIFKNPPYEMRWVKNHPKRKIYFSFITSKEKGVEWLKEKCENLVVPSFQSNTLLSLRAFLAYGILEHCLSLRHRVDFGVDSRRGFRKRTAVPYRASDTPSERAEYAQPDTLILFTQLSYYHSGITRQDIIEAVKALMILGPMAQQAEYSLWYESSLGSLSQEHQSMINTVDKLDVSNVVLVDVLHEVYGFNMALIDFWLGSCIFPRETMQFPSRLTANSFNLAETPSGQITGFSGTKDTELLLPLQVKQNESFVPSLHATDGKMMELVLKNKQVVMLKATDQTCKTVLHLALKNKTNALIDAGAAMAGVLNVDVGKAFLALLNSTNCNSEMKGVVYFDNSESTWVVQSRHGRIWPLGSAPIQVKEAFVYFDESRCRGADMKLLENATALLTLGPMMCKDKLMQAAGRMRQLDHGQSIIFVVPEELSPLIFPTGSEILPEHILRWVLENNVTKIARGLPMWSLQGALFCSSLDPKGRLLDEKVELQELYGNSFIEQSVLRFVEKILETEQKRTKKLELTVHEKSNDMLSYIKSHSAQYGSDQNVYFSGLDEECEREIEHEREIELEIQVQIPRQLPQSSCTWDFSALLSANSPTELPPESCVMTLKDAIDLRFSKQDFNLISWQKCDIFVTKNFTETVLDMQKGEVEDQSSYMRPVDVVIVFEESSTCLLLSEWEAEKILSIMWNFDNDNSSNMCCGSRPYFVNLIYLLEHANGNGVGEPRLKVPKSTRDADSLKTRLSDLTLAGLQLLAGHTMYGTKERKIALGKLIQSHGAKKAALRLIETRGKRDMVCRSDLEEACAFKG